MAEKLPVQIETWLYRRTASGQPEYLLMKRNEARGGFWQSLTGGQEVGEQLIDTLRREVREETGITNLANITDLKHTFQYQSKDNRTITEHVFAARVPASTQVVLSDEHTKYKWLNYQQAHDFLKWPSNKEALVIVNRFLIKKSNHG